MATSFKKKASSKPSHPRGTKPSLHNAQLLVSTGVPSLDVLLGGGLAVGTVLLVEEDTFGSYSRLLLKYFLSEGIMCGHALFLATASEKPDDILKDLPGAVGEEEVPRLPPLREQVEEEEMEIAWRYRNLPKVQSSFSNRFGHFFDLTTNMDPARVEAVDKVLFDATDNPASTAGELYSDLRSSVEETVGTGHFFISDPTTQQKNILRIGIHSLGSPLWLQDGETTPHTLTPHTFTLTQFLHSLRALLRRAYAVAMVTIPTHLMQQDVASVRRLCDAAVRMESFAGSEKEQSPLYKEYHGLFHLHKLPRLNSFTCHFPETLDLAFKLKRKKFSIEKLHLPPELSETSSRPQEDAPQKKTAPQQQSSSRTGGSKHIDF